MKTINYLCDFFWNFKFKFKFKIKMKTLSHLYFNILLCIMLCLSGVASTSDYVQSFERVAVFHNHVTYGHLGVTIDFDGYLNHFHVLRKSVLSFEEKHMSVYVKSVFSRLVSTLDTNKFTLASQKNYLELHAYSLDNEQEEENLLHLYL